MLPSDVVRALSAVFFFLTVSSFLLFFPRAARRGPRTVRASRALSFSTGPLWESVQAILIFSLLAEAALPDWVYGGPLTVSFPFDFVFQVIGMALWLTGGALSIWAMRTLGRFTRPEIEVLSDHRLVTEGPYGRVRHPLYTALLMMGAGVAVFMLNALLGAIAVLSYAIARRRAFLEEELLSSEDGLGLAYRQYMEATGRFLPRLGRKAREAVDGNL
jgi:protein-S-isoprenylcysteine O-methyltransferase Ste14